jgi:hypothetical protein
LIPVTVPEVRRRLLAQALPPTERVFDLHWSRWRRRRQAEARSHDKRRLARSDADVPLSY